MEKIKKLIRKEKNTISINDFIVKSNPFDKINLKDLDVKKEEDKYNVKIIPSLENYTDEYENEKEIIREFTQKNNEYINEENIYNTSISLDGKTITFGDKTHKVVLILNTLMEWTSKLNESKNEILFSDSNGLCLIKLQDYGINIKTSIVSNLTYNYELTNLILEIENKTLLFKDTSTNEIIFKLGPIFAYENIDNQTSNIFIDKDSTTITFTLDNTWKNNCSNPIFIESNFHIESKPLITLHGEKNGFNENSIDNKFILGIYNKNSFSIKAKINTYNIISELLKCNYTNYKILIKFHFENGKRRNDSCGFKIYNDSQEIGFDYLNDSYFNVNITDLIKYQIDNSIFDKDIVLTIIYAEFIKEIFGSDENLKTNIIDDYCYIYNESNDINNRPEIIFSCANESTVKDGNKFLSYSIKDLGESNINLFTGKLQHIINLDTIKENNLSLNIDLVYDNRTKNKNVLVDGWSINLQQKLIKKKDYNKILGSKDIIYIDGYNNQHVLSEKWFYMKDDIKHYIRKEDVFIDNDKKLKYRLNNDIFDVEYESSNEEGLRFFSFNNLNYIKKSDMKVEKKYFILLHDNEKLYLTKGKYISIPVFYNSEDIDIKNDQYELSLLPSRFKNYAEIKANKIKHYLGITYRDGKYYDLSNNIIPYKIIDCPILYKNNKQYVRIPTKIYKFKKESNNGYTEYTNKRISGRDVFIYSEDSLYVDRSTPIIDYYSNNDIDNINNQIKQVNDYIISLKEQCENISNTIIKTNSELEIMDINNEQYPLLKTDISTYEKSLNICANKLQEYEIKLCNLNETKKYLIDDQKQNIHDYIFNKDGNILGFDYYGKLIYISDKYDNEINIIYDDNKLTEINSKHNKIIFHYDDKKRLNYFIDSANRKKTIACSNRFIKINYNNDVINQFVFVQSKLISIANSNESIKFQYNQDNQITKISHTTFFDEISSEDSTKLSKVISDKTITYDKFSTTVLDNLYENK